MANEKTSSTDLSEISDQELERELAHRRGRKLAAGRLLAAEDAVEQYAHAHSHQALQQMMLQRMQTQDTAAKPCPKCGKPVGVRTKNRERTVRTMSGELTLGRHYHYCQRCEHGFYPLDIELGLPAEGELSSKMMARVLDFGVTTVFAEAAERWSVHHSGTSISENLVRLVVERSGRTLQEQDAESRQTQIRPAPAQAPTTVVVMTDGSMLSMRAQSQWKEVKVGVIYTQEHHLPGTKHHRGSITEARYTASMRGIDDFRTEIDAGLQAERALEANRIAWIADGAPWNWSLCDELCPSAVQVLDFMHMAQHAADCGKAVLGEQSPWLETWNHSIVERIDAGALQHVLADLRDIKTHLPADARSAVDNLIGYYETNAGRMNYPLYRSLLVPIGSGAVESAHRHVIQNRMKLAGQHWTHPRAHRMALLRCAYKTAGPARFAQSILPLAA